MSRLDELAALAAQSGAAVRKTAAVAAGDVEVAQVVKDVDASVLAAAHNAFPRFVATARAALALEDALAHRKPTKALRAAVLAEIAAL